MQIDTAQAEQMAREYNAALAQTNPPTERDELLERLLYLNENQLDMINTVLSGQQNARNSKILSYLRTLTFNIIANINALRGVANYAPAFRNPERMSVSCALSRLISTQIDIFVNLDKLYPLDNASLYLNVLENRKMGILSLLV